MKVFGQLKVFGSPFGMPSGGAPTPPLDQQLPATNRIFGWYAGNGLVIPSTIFQDDGGGGNTEIADGGAIKQWDDVGGVHSLTQATLGSRPTWQSDGFGSLNRAVSEYDDGDIIFKIVTGGVLARAGLTTFTHYMVVSQTAADASDAWYGEGSTTSGTPFYAVRLHTTRLGDLRVSARSDAASLAQRDTSGLSLADGNPHLIIVERVILSPAGDSTFAVYTDRNATPAITGTYDSTGQAYTVNRIAMGGFFTGSTTPVSLIEGKIALNYAYDEARDAAKVALMCDHYGIV